MQAMSSGLLLVPCPTCRGLAVKPRAVWVYEPGCGFGHDDAEEDACPECEGNGQVLVEGEPITMQDLENM
jgi:hypothetical protein